MLPNLRRSQDEARDEKHRIEHAGARRVDGSRDGAGDRGWTSATIRADGLGLRFQVAPLPAARRSAFTAAVVLAAECVRQALRVAARAVGSILPSQLLKRANTMKTTTHYVVTTNTEGALMIDASLPPSRKKVVRWGCSGPWVLAWVRAVPPAHELATDRLFSDQRSATSNGGMLKKWFGSRWL
jgi:hypothetical protein